MRARKKAPKGGRILWMVAAATVVAAGAVSILGDDGEPTAANDTRVVAASRIDTTAAPQAAVPAATPAEPQAAPSSPAGGYIAYIDPETGRLIPKPPPDDADVIALTASTAAGFSRSHEGLYEEVLPSGAIKLNLQGRFKSSSFATLGEDGKVHVSHRVPQSPSPSGPAPDNSAGPEKQNEQEKNDDR